MKKILIPIDYYLPSYKAGGPINSISNIIEKLGDEFSFKILTRDRDIGDKKPFENIKKNIWIKKEKTSIYYITPSQRISFSFIKLLRSADYDVLYLNSFFSFFFSILFVILLKIRLIQDVKVIIAPRGELAP